METNMTIINQPNTPAEELVGEWVNLGGRLDEDMAVLAELDVPPSLESLPDDFIEYTITFETGEETTYDLLWLGRGKYIITERYNWRERVSFVK